MSFKGYFVLGLLAAILAVGASIIYSQLYYSVLVDFSEGAGSIRIGSYCLIVTMSACFLGFGLDRLILKTGISALILNVLLFCSAFTLAFMLLKENDPVFKNEDANIMVCYFKGFLMPLVFFPALSWMTIRPLFKN